MCQGDVSPDTLLPLHCRQNKRSRMKNKKHETKHDIKPGIGIVLCGGGTKGAYEIGVWKSLEEMGIFDKITGFSGASIGAFNSAFMVDGDIDKAVAVWNDFNVFDFLNLNKEKIAKKIINGASKTAPENIKENFDVVRASKKAAGKLWKVSLAKGRNGIREIKRSFDTFNADPRVKKRLMLERTVSPEVMSYNKRPFRNFGIWFMLNAVGSGFATSEKLKGILDQNVILDPERLKNIDAFSVICDWDQEKNVSGKAVYVSWKGKSRKEIIDLINVSGALPVLYREGVYNGKRYVDGGYADNEPIKPLYDAGYRKLIIVYLDCLTGSKLKRRIKAQEKAFPGAKFIRIVPGKDIKDSFASSLVLTHEITVERIKLGYEDGMKTLADAPDKWWK